MNRELILEILRIAISAILGYILGYVIGTLRNINGKTEKKDYKACIACGKPNTPISRIKVTNKNDRQYCEDCLNEKFNKYL